MTKILVALGSAVTPDSAELDGLKAAGFELGLGKSAPTTPVGDVIEYLQGCAAVAAGGEPYTEEVFAACPELRLVLRFGVGFDAVDVEAATRHGVVIANTPGTNDWGVADHAMGLIIDLAHRISRHDRADPSRRLGQPARRRRLAEDHRDHRAGADRQGRGSPSARLRHARAGLRAVSRPGVRQGERRRAGRDGRCAPPERLRDAAPAGDARATRSSTPRSWR